MTVLRFQRKKLTKGKLIAPQIIILSSIIVTAAFMIRGLTGFGSGLIMVPMLLLLFDLTGLAESMRLVVPTAAVLAVFSGIILILTFRTRKWIRSDVLLMIVAGTIIGTPLGTYVLASCESSVLKRLFGLFLSGYALKMLLERQTKVREIGNYLGFFIGFLGGCLGGMFSTGGPPVIIYLNRKIEDKRTFRATLILYFLIANTWQCVTLCYTRLMNGEVLKLVLYLLPAFIAGNLIGSILHIKINQVLFRRVVALVLLLAGVLLCFEV